MTTGRFQKKLAESGKDRERAEILEVRDLLLKKIIILLLYMGLPAVLFGAFQSYQQGRWPFSMLYLGMYVYVLIVTLLGERISYNIRALALVMTLFLISSGILLRIGLSGVGLELMISACVLSFVLMGVKASFLTGLGGALVICVVGSGMVFGYIDIRAEDMLNSTSGIAWITSGVVFGTLTFGLILLPQMFQKRLNDSLDLLENRTENLERSNERLREEILARETAESALREGEERLKLIYETIPDPVTIIDAEDGRCIDVNDGFVKMTGWSKGEVIGKTADEINIWQNPSDRKKMVEDISRFGRTKNLEAIFRFKHGKTITGLMSAVLVSIDRKPHIITITRDITERKEFEDALRESEEKYRLVVENANEGIVITKGNKVVFVNQRTLDYSGYIEKDLDSTVIAGFIHPDDRDEAIDRYIRILNGEKFDDYHDYRAFDKEGNIRWITSHSVLIDWKGEPAILTFMNEITGQKTAEEEKKRLERNLQQAQKMEAVGTLAGGIAHDFNNLLMGIQGNASLMLLEMTSSDSHFEKLKNIEEYVKSGASLTKQLLGFARSGRYEVRPTDMNGVVKKSSELFGRTKKEISIYTKYQDEIWPVEVDRGQIEQVLLNIYVNAWQSMPGGGELYIETENVLLDENTARHFSVNPGRYVRISVADTGVGMDRATRERIFEPFFTTREMGRGTGLGLASAYGIVRSHGGMISVNGEKGKGSIFKILLPATEKKVVIETESSKTVIRGAGTILLVDDEEMIADVGSELLQTMGYSVLVARNGREAVNLFRENSEEIDLVILDMVMPDIGGGDTFDKLKEIAPDVKVLLSSGYSIEGEATEILKRGCKGFIQKPFDIEDFSRKIREIMEEK